MLWRKGRRSDNVVDARDDSGGGMGGGGMRIGGRGLSLGGVAIVVVVGLLMGQDPMQILGSLLGQMDTGQAPARPQVQGRPATGADPQVDFVRAVLGDTEDTWGQIFAHSNAQYEQPKLILFNGGEGEVAFHLAPIVGGPWVPALDTTRPTGEPPADAPAYPAAGVVPLPGRSVMVLTASGAP